MLFGREKETWVKWDAYYTASEIYQQPATWKKTIEQIGKEKEALQAFINKVVTQKDYDIVLTGAGTSEFIGRSIYPFLEKKYDHKVKCFGTTDIVADPESYLSADKPTLLVSYGRSGDSPESIGALNVANVVCNNIYHLFITCNKDGALSKAAQGKDNYYAINLTPETLDKSFAMTSSYTNMLLATLLAFNLDEYETYKAQMNMIIANTQNFLDNGYGLIETIVNSFDFDRIVYLGSNNLAGVAQESALKICELTAGQVDTIYNTPLGFRHGPKSVIKDNCLCVVYLSDGAYTRQYELDIIKEMSRERKLNKIMVVSSCQDTIVSYTDYFVSFNNKDYRNNVMLGMEYVIVAQLVALFKSLMVNNTPDNPSKSGIVNRVVKGVDLYPYVKK